MSDAKSLPPIAIIGFGFGGLMVLANLLREAAAPLTIYVIDPELNARGAAYSTDQPLHLLNVAAGRMGAWREAPEDFIRWLQSDAGKYACAAQKLPTDYTGSDYIPRLLYGEYLQSIWQETQTIAAQKNCSIKLVPSRAVAVRKAGDELTIATERGDAIATQYVVLAVGNEAKLIYSNLPREKIIQRPWDVGALNAAARTAKSIAIIGTSLTAIDAILSLRALGFGGKITALSRNGLLPRTHRVEAKPYHFKRDALLQHATSMATLLLYIRGCIRTQPGDWREVIDALRPHTQAIWRRLSSIDQQRFFNKLASFWGVHRHRMAPSIYARLEIEIAAQQLQLIAAQHLRASVENDQVILHWRQGGSMHQLSPDIVINCTGVAFDIRRSKNALLQQLLSDGLIEPHSTHIGIATDAHGSPCGHAEGKLYAMGGLLTGQLLESIAVPELREQAQAVAYRILKRIA